MFPNPGCLTAGPPPWWDDWWLNALPGALGRAFGAASLCWKAVAVHANGLLPVPKATPHGYLVARLRERGAGRPMVQRLVFVYNADGGHLAGLKDLFHKILSPATYPCSLCAITYGAASMRPEWREFIKTLPVPVDFLHRDEFVRAYPQGARHALPAAFALAENGVLTPFIEAPEMDAADLDGLMALVRQRL